MRKFEKIFGQLSPCLAEVQTGHLPLDKSRTIPLHRCGRYTIHYVTTFGDVCISLVGC